MSYGRYGRNNSPEAAAAVSHHPRVVAIAVSEGGAVRVFCGGKLAAEITPR